MEGPLSRLQPCSSKFLQAAKAGDVQRLQRCLSEDHALLLHKGLLGAKSTAWHLAAAKGRPHVLRALHEELLTHAGLVVYLLARRGKGHLSHEAAIQATVNSRDVKGRTPLMLACLAGQVECATLLLAMGADPWLTDKCGAQTALHYAAVRGSVGCIHALVDAVPPAQRTRVLQGRQVSFVDAGTLCGFTPLHCAAVFSQSAAVRALLACGADAGAQTTAEGSYEMVYLPKGSTPLHVSAKHGDVQAVWEFLHHLAAHADSRRGRDPRTCLNVDGHAPYHVAGLRGHTLAAELLHPWALLRDVLDDAEVEPVGVPRLSLLAAAALKASLLAMVEEAAQQLGRASSAAHRAQAACLGTASLGKQSQLVQDQIPAAGWHQGAASCPASHSVPAGRNSRGGSFELVPRAADVQAASGDRLAGSSALTCGGITSVAGMERLGPICRGMGPQGREHDRAGAEGPAGGGACSGVGHQGGHSEKAAGSWGAAAGVDAGIAQAASSAQTATATQCNASATALGTASAGSTHGPADRAGHAGGHALSRATSAPVSLGPCGRGYEPAAGGTMQMAARAGLAAGEGRGAQLARGSDARSMGTSHSHRQHSPCLPGEEQQSDAVPRQEQQSDAASCQEQQALHSLHVQYSHTSSIALCAVCLDEASQQLLLDPCHHLLCAACARKLVQAIRDRPLACPMCRQPVRACHAAVPSLPCSPACLSRPATQPC